MAYIQGENREQMTLSPMCLDDYIGADSVCRVIDAFTRSLDLTGLGFKYTDNSDKKADGRPSYAPTQMLALYLYGYMNRVRSSRRLEAETRRNVEVMWLMDKLAPDDKTICNFRKDNSAVLKKVFRQFSLWCNRQGLYGKELVAVDGTKIRANAHRKNIHTQKGTEKELVALEKKISEYMNELETNDATEADDAKLDAAAVRETLKRLNERKEKLADWLKQIEANDGAEISTVDPDAHIMHSGGDARPLDACYNVQAVADAKHKLILDFDVSTCPDDSGALSKMIEAAKEIMGVDKIDATADKGYYDGKDIADCEQSGTTCYVPKLGELKHASNPAYDKINFKYDAENNCYICPNGTVLPFRQVSKYKDGSYPSLTYYDTKACRNCPDRDKCTTNKNGRHISRSPHQDALDSMNARMKTSEGKEILRQRKKIIEHPFGTTKAVWGFKQFLCRTQERVTGEQSLAFLAYNLRRVINIFATNREDLVAAMA